MGRWLRDRQSLAATLRDEREARSAAPSLGIAEQIEQVGVGSP
ncbi:MAG: hypothetical protein RL685_2813, partial [Pseudomonadota bacterium]